MPCPENIIPPVKGEVRNPKGRGKGVPNRSTLLKKWLQAMTDATLPDGEKKKIPLSDAVALALIKKALKGDVAAYKEIMDSLHGPMAQNINLTAQTPQKPEIVVNSLEGTEEINKFIDNIE